MAQSSEDLVNIKIPRATYDFLVELSKEMKTQDNHCTASPHFYVIKVKEEIAVPDNYDYDRKVLVHRDWDDPFDTEEEAKEALANEEISQRSLDEAYWVHLKNIKRDENVFFTEKAYFEHLRINRHNLRDPHFYIKHAWRNEEMENLFEAIHTIGNTKELSEQRAHEALRKCQVAMNHAIHLEYVGSGSTFGMFCDALQAVKNIIGPEVFGLKDEWEEALEKNK